MARNRPCLRCGGTRRVKVPPRPGVKSCPPATKPCPVCTVKSVKGQEDEDG
jgi:hypothetical protein